MAPKKINRDLLNRLPLVNIADFDPDETESAFQAAYARTSADARKHLAGFLASRAEPVVWFVGPGLPGRELADFLHQTQLRREAAGLTSPLQVYVVDRNPAVIQTLQAQIEAPAAHLSWHVGSVLDTTLPHADAMVFNQMLIFLSGQAQKQLVGRVRASLKPGARVYYTHHERRERVVDVDLYSGGSTQVRVVEDTEPFHRALSKNTRNVLNLSTGNPFVSYRAVENRVREA